jgi:tRNA dimethylallyltransferase
VLKGNASWRWPARTAKTFAAGTPLEAQVAGKSARSKRARGTVVVATEIRYRFLLPMNLPPVAIIGPTASGKSALALAVARRQREIELISVDSMQVYRGMDIGTAKPTRLERAEVPHHGIDLVDPDEEFSLADFVAMGRHAIADVESRGCRAVLVGGTGLYLRALLDELDLPGQFPQVRDDLEAEPDTRALYSQLLCSDPNAAARMEPDNRRRIIRALEVTIGSGRPFSSFGPGLGAYPVSRFQIVGICSSRELGRKRIDARVEKMMAEGFVEEVRMLRQQFALSKTARQALGYREILSALETDADPHAPEVVDEIKSRTRSFARRQRVWFRRDPRIKWFTYESDPFEVLDDLLRELNIRP